MDHGTQLQLQQQQQQQGNPLSDGSPPPERQTESPESEQPPANKDGDSAQLPSEQSPTAEQPADEGAAGGEAAEKSTAEMTVDLRSFRKPGEKTFTQRSRLFVGNLPQNMTEEEFKNMFAKFGDVNEVFVNGERGFGLIRLVSYAATVSLILSLFNAKHTVEHEQVHASCLASARLTPPFSCSSGA